MSESDRRTEARAVHIHIAIAPSLRDCAIQLQVLASRRLEMVGSVMGWTYNSPYKTLYKVSVIVLLL